MERNYTVCLRWRERGVARVERSFEHARALAERELYRLVGGEHWAHELPDGRSRLHLLGGRWGATVQDHLQIDLLTIEDETTDADQECFLVGAALRMRLQEGSLVAGRRKAWELSARLENLGLTPVMLPAEDARQRDGLVLPAEPNIRSAGQIVETYLAKRGLFDSEIAEAIEHGEIQAVPDELQAFVRAPSA